MENLAEAQTGTETSLPTFLYGMRPHLNHFHSVTVISANTDADWIVALLDLKRLNVKASLALVDPESFGSDRSVCGQWWQRPRPSCFRSTWPSGGGRLDSALSRPVNRESLEGAELAPALGVER